MYFWIAGWMFSIGFFAILEAKCGFWERLGYMLILLLLWPLALGSCILEDGP